MRAAQMKERPDFPLMRQTDVQQIYHMQMPRWLFSDRRYSDMSLEAKVAIPSCSTDSSSPAGMAGSMSGEKSLSFFRVRSWPRSFGCANSG